MRLVSEVTYLWQDFGEKDVTFYNQSKQPLWSGRIDNTWSGATKYVSAYNVQTWNKDGSPRKNSAKVKPQTQIFPGYYYSFGLTPEGVTPQPEGEQVLTQAQIDAKLREYVTQQLSKRLHWKGSEAENPWDKELLNSWHIPEVVVEIFKELTE